MALYRLTNIFQLTTIATVPTAGTSRTGGWSESYWTDSTPDIFDPLWTGLDRARAVLLPAQASIVGYRQQNYVISGNKLLPGGTVSGKQQSPGNASYPCDSPSQSLEIYGQTNTTSGSTRFRVTAIPDQFITTGEFAPTPDYIRKVNNYLGLLKNSVFGWVGRDISQQAVRVLAFNAGVVTTEAPIAGVAANVAFVRFHRCYDQNGNPVKGSYLVTAIGAGNTYTLQNAPAQTVVKPSGLIRLDQLAYFTINTTSFGEIVQRKVGKPLNAFRGKRSKSRV